MKTTRHTLLTILTVLCAFAAHAQNFIGTSQQLPVGAYYYPEHWSEEEWETDLKLIAQLGFTFTHFAEFAWAQLEPQEGVFNFDWLDRCVALAQQYGLKVIMCTPSPTPPVWLTEKHPEVSVVTDENRIVRHGMRLNCNGNNPVFRKYLRRILEKMAERYGDHPAVCGWQVDNEPHFEGLYDYSDFARSDFRRWLQEKYGDIETLNEAWGADFWSYRFQNFDQIHLPNAREHTGNPHAFIDFRRYTADAIAAALRFQVETLRPKIAPHQWITTNFAYYKFLPSVDPFRSRNDFDFVSHTMYLTSTSLNYDTGMLAHRLGSGMELAFSTELARSVEGRTGIMELQPGQINWGRWNSQPLPGAVRMWIWHSFALGDEFVCTYRFKQPLYGGEQFHKGIIEPDGKTVSPGGEEYVQAIREINSLPVLDARQCKQPRSWTSRNTALLWKADNLMALEEVKHTQFWDTWDHVYTYYQKLKTLGVAVTFVQESDRLTPEKYPFAIAPAYEMVAPATVSRWKNYVREGGILVLTVRSGMKDNNAHLWKAPLQYPIYNLIGGKIEYFDQLPPSRPATIEFDGKLYGWHLWGDILSPDGQTEVWATYADQFYAGKPCVTKHKLGKGAVYYIGVCSDDKSLEQALLRKIYLENGAEILDLPDYVFTEFRNGYWITVNYSSEPAEAPVPAKARILFGERTVQPGSVTVWR